MEIKHCFDKATNTLTYIASKEGQAIVIDPVLNYEPQSSTVSYRSITEVDNYLAENNLELLLILETHAHADHISASQFLKEKYPTAKLAVSQGILKVQKTFSKIYNLLNMPINGSQFDILLEEGRQYNFGALSFEVIFTPGHTPACACFKFGEHLFTGDSLFMPDFGTGRCDFPDGSATDLYNSITNKLYTLPDDTIVYVGHDYMPAGRELKYKTTINDSKLNNIHLKANTSEEEFVSFRTERDSTLRAPKLLLPAIQININGGKFFSPENNGTSYLKIPVNFEK